MPARGLAALAIAFAIAACSDPAAPNATISDDPSLIAGGGAAHFLGGKKKIAVRGKHGHDRDHHDKPECGEDGDRDHHDRWGKRGHHGHHSKWHKRHDARRGKRGHADFHLQRHGEGQNEECGGGEDLPATIGGTVTNNGAGANAFPVFLLNPQGTTVVASTTTATDGTGSYSFTDVAAGPYLVCEADPFLEIYGYLGQTRPDAGPPCPAGYAPIGFVVAVAGGETAGGNDFANYGLE